jgi:hypothetical protein
MRVRTTLISSCFAVASIFLLHATQAFAEDPLDNWHYRTNQILSRVRFVGGIFIGLGQNGMLMTSSDGVHWTKRETGTAAELTGAAFGQILSPSLQSTYMVVGRAGTILSSIDATNWNLVATAHSCDLNDVVYAPLHFRFVVGTTRATTAQPNALISTDGAVWEGVEFPFPLGMPSSFGSFYTSTLTVAGGAIIAAGGILFIADVWRSTTGGSTWQRLTNSNSSGQGIAFGGGRTLIVGVLGKPFVSGNGGNSWSSVTNGLFPMDFGGTDVAYGSGTFLVSRSYASLLSTPDCIIWKTNNFFGRASGVAYGDGTFVIATQTGIYQSDSLIAPRITPRWDPLTRWLVLTISGEVGRGYRLQTTTDFEGWSDFRSYTNSAPTTEIWYPAYSDAAPHFFRVVSP